LGIETAIDYVRERLPATKHARVLDYLGAGPLHTLMCFLGRAQILPRGGCQLGEALDLSIGIISVLDLSLRDDKFPMWLAVSADMGGLTSWREESLRQHHFVVRVCIYEEV